VLANSVDYLLKEWDFVAHAHHWRCPLQKATLSKDDWAKYALLVIYAWDMCDLNQDPASNDVDPRILADGWRPVGIISGKDNVLATAPSARQGIPPQNAGLRQSVVRPGLIFGGTGISR
jgi:hypothetical protein